VFYFSSNSSGRPRSGSPETPGHGETDAFLPRDDTELKLSMVKAREADGIGDVCVAPCGVHFDATGTEWVGHSRAEADLDLEYRWSFGDPKCSTDGVFEASGKSCNAATGFVAAHLFEAAGNYTVTLCVPTAQDDACISTEVVVADPDEVYAGKRTVCVSANDDHAGCPSGAEKVSFQRDFDAALKAHLKADARVLFHRGQTFHADDSFTFVHSHNRMLVGAYGAGASPRVEAAGVTLFENTCGPAGRGGPAPVDVRIVGIQIHGGASFIRLQDPAQQVTVSHVTLTGRWLGGEFGQIFQWRDQIAYCQAGRSPGPADQWFLVENDHAVSEQGRNLSMTARRSAALGNVFRGAPSDHVVRWHVAKRNIISHNSWLGRPKAGLHQLKYHAGKFNDGAFGGMNEYSVISNNFCHGRNGIWSFTLGQQGQASPPPERVERASRMLVEDNYFKDTDGSVQIFVTIDADQSRFSGNVCERQAVGTTGIACGYFAARDPWPMVGQNRAHSNILFDGASHKFNSRTIEFTTGSGNRAHGNIVWAPDSGRDVAVEGLATCAPGGCFDNRSTRDFASIPFVSQAPQSLDDYELRVE
jgi:hypothetical protein